MLLTTLNILLTANFSIDITYLLFPKSNKKSPLGPFEAQTSSELDTILAIYIYQAITVPLITFINVFQLPFLVQYALY